MWQILTGGEWYSTCWQPLLTCSTRWRSWRSTCPRCRQRRCGRGACSQKPLRHNPPPADRCPCVPAGRTRAATSSSRLQVVNSYTNRYQSKCGSFEEGARRRVGRRGDDEWLVAPHTRPDSIMVCCWRQSPCFLIFNNCVEIMISDLNQYWWLLVDIEGYWWVSALTCQTQSGLVGAVGDTALNILMWPRPDRSGGIDFFIVIVPSINKSRMNRVFSTYHHLDSPTGSSL